MSIVRALASVLLLTVASAMPMARISVASPAEQQDDRLSTPVNACFHQERLHRVTDALSKAAGVTITCGADPQDWRARDTPVSVIAEAIPLQTLLTALADAAALRVQSVTESGKAAYNIRDDPAAAAKIEAYVRARQEYARARRTWELRSLAVLKGLPASEISRMPNDTAGPAVAMSRLICSLPSDVREKVISGRTVRLNYSSQPSAVRKRLRDFVLAVTRMQKQQAPNSASAITNDALEQVRLTFYSEDAGIGFYLFNSGAGNHQSALGSYLTLTYRGRLHAYGIPDEPRLPAQPEIAPATTGLIEIDYSHGQADGLLQTKLTLPTESAGKPADLTVADVLAAVSRATGCAVVAQDFASQLTDRYHVLQLASKEITVGEALWAVGGEGAYGMRWWYQESKRLIVGRCRNWTQARQNLLPESYLTALRAKLDGDGLELDDCLGVLLLPYDQRSEWIARARGFRDMGTIGFNHSTKLLWPLYYALSQEQKKQAATPSALPLAELPAGVVSAAISDAHEDALRQRIAIHEDLTEQQLSDLASRPLASTRLVMRLIKSSVILDRSHFSAPNSDSRTPGSGSLRHTYRLEVSVFADGAETTITCLGPGLFPHYSARREKEIAEQQPKSPAGQDRLPAFYSWPAPLGAAPVATK